MFWVRINRTFQIVFYELEREYVRDLNFDLSLVRKKRLGICKLLVSTVHIKLFSPALMKLLLFTYFQIKQPKSPEC